MNHDTILRIDELERLWPVMRDKLKYYDVMMSKISDLESKVVLHEVNANKNNDYLSSKIDKYIDLQQFKHDRLCNDYNNLSECIVTIGETLEVLKKEMQNQKSSINEINDDLAYLTTALNNCSKIKELDALKQDFKNLSKECRQYHVACDVNVLSLYDEHQKVLDLNDKMLKDLKEGQALSSSEGFKLKRELQALQDETKSLKLTQNTMFHDLKNAFNPIIDDKISAIPVPVIPSLDDAKSAMQKVLEPVSLDAKNANLRSTNTDAKLHILEKKIEQLKLMLDQITLGA